MACSSCGNTSVINPLGQQTIVDSKPLMTQQIKMSQKITFPIIPPAKMIFLPRQMPVQVFLNRFNTGR